MVTYETYISQYGTGYRVLVSGVAVREQPFKVGPGFVGMTLDEATAAAQAEVAALTAEAAIVAPAVPPEVAALLAAGAAKL